MNQKAPDPGRDIALIALNGSPTNPGDMLEEVLTYCFDQLCWRRTTPELIAVLKRLDTLISDEI